MIVQLDLPDAGRVEAGAWATVAMLSSGVWRVITTRQSWLVAKVRDEGVPWEKRSVQLQGSWCSLRGLV